MTGARLPADGEPAAETSAPAYPAMAPLSVGAPAVPLPPWYDGLRPAPGEPAALLRLAGLLMLAGLPLGVLWWLVAPRRAYLVAEQGAFAVVPDSEAAVGSDGWFMLLTGALALVAAFVAWRRLRHRGPLVPVALAAGLLACGLVCWLVGSLLGPGPSATELAQLGQTVLGPLELRAHGALAVGPFLAVTGYLLGACFTARDDLSRSGRGSSGRARGSVGRVRGSVGARRSVGRARNGELDERHRDGT